MTHAIDFYLPFRYLHRIRLKQWSKIVSWWLLMILPTATYFLSFATNDGFYNILNYILLLLIVVMYYELGYIYNDAITTQKEELPTMRLSSEALQYGRQHIGLIYFVRLALVLVLMFVVGYLNQWQEWLIITFIWVLLLQPIFLIYNTLRNRKAILFYPILVGWRYLSFIWIGMFQPHWVDACFLLLLSYPLEISIERFSMPKHRVRLIRDILPNEEAKLWFRVLYYICAISISAIMIKSKQLPITWLLPFAFLFLYRLIIWIHLSNKTIRNMSRLFVILYTILCSGLIMAEPLPRINLTYAQLDKDTFNIGEFQFINAKDTLSFSAKVRHRGRSSSLYDKPAYAIKLIDSLGESIDASFLGMREDNYWVLDAMASDKARMRNRVAMDLWFEISRQPWYNEQEPKCINGYRGQMVVVYVNGQNYGLYHFMERIDRKQLKLQKYSEKKGIRGVLYKSIHWGGTANYSAPTTIPSNTSSEWDSWELKYPDLEDGEPIKWEPLYDLISFVNYADSTTFADSIAYRLDLPVFVDYVLFCQLISARDNDAKNTYISFYDATYQRALYTPWDLDHSWGRQYNGKEEGITENLFLGNNLFLRLNQDYPHFSNMLNDRWKELRQHYFTIEHIDSLFAPYFNLYTTTGLATIEQNIWSGHNDLYFNIASEQSYIHNWVSQRICFLDKLYQYNHPSSAIESHPIYSTPHIKLMKNGQIYVIKDNHTYNLMGIDCFKN